MQRLGIELRNLRERVGATLDEIAGEFGWSAAKLSRIEQARSAVTAGDLERLLEHYRVAGEHRDRLRELGDSGSRRNWWDAYDRRTVSAALATYIDFESEAVEIRAYRLSLVHGLLQTPRYMRAVMEGSAEHLTPGEIERRIEVRRRRQERLTASPALQLRVVCEEGVLRRSIGGPDVMNEQLRHLVAQSALPNVRLQVIPFDAPLLPGGAVSFNLLRFPDTLLPELLYVEIPGGSIFRNDERSVYEYATSFEGVGRAALSSDESREFISALIAEM
ncbi:helix-turn-helix domain-containing protein [Actinomadura parmotrematis]|uniref:Helix-turn-helix domain-containing protein n=1 Tax=Actinomadura parmotrematis TaxID=2864039 RepID=A0ABS7G1Y7_9ACTN|nr:helix-turn-helix transcriptional regulator [Actinomadura parmotrematis]MBW8485663.1 helix-turn-helix domain-containing protein [Actinomadura parmotrematis]